MTILLAFVLGSEVDIVVVRPASWESALTEWKSHREQQGYRITEVEPAETAEATRERIRNAGESASRCFQFVVLANDAPAYFDLDDLKKRNEKIMTFYVDSKVVKDFGSEPTIATDYPYADYDQDGKIDAAVGRIPANSAKELKDYLAKVVAYETTSSFKAWRREVDVVAGVGGFGAIADSVVEATTRQLLTNDIPQEFRLSMTYASPTSVYCPDPTRFSDAAIDRMNDGGLFWIYLGHGYIDTLDFVPYGNRQYSILDRSSVQQISIASGPPIVVFLACYVGAFDAREPSIAERLLMQPNGPIAIVAGTRVTMPYGMGILGGEMLDQCFRKKCKSIGEILRHAKFNTVGDSKLDTSDRNDAADGRRKLLDSLATALSPEGHSIADERIEHTYLFNLLGDPIVQIHHPRPMTIETLEEVTAGTELLIRGHSPIRGKMIVEMTYSRQRIPETAKELKQEKREHDSLERQQAIYEAANHLTIHQIEMPVEAGDFAVNFPVDLNCHGSYVVQATVYGSSTWSAGSTPIRVKRP
ncbi:MAG: C25 family cysteine peptidase [Pirellulaceae bacterium]|nr:C25 family cysteine peptidase [Pirellulaceae bacterium]